MKLEIADISFHIDDNAELKKEFEKFSLTDSHSTSHVKLKTVRKSLPIFPSKNLLFKAEKFWSIYGNKERYIVFDYFNSHGAQSSRVGVFNKDYTEGKIFIENHNFNKQNSNIKNPLSYPIGSVLMSNLLAKGKGVFIHAAGIKTSDGKGCLLCGKSESGKSTLAKLWRDNDNVTILNDDRVILRKKNNKFYLYGCPWHTESEFISNQRVVVDKIFFVFHGKKNTIKKLDNRLAKLDLLKNTYFPIWDKKGINFSLQFLEDMAKDIECFNLKFVPDESVIESIEKI